MFIVAERHLAFLRSARSETVTLLAELPEMYTLRSINMSLLRREDGLGLPLCP